MRKLKTGKASAVSWLMRIDTSHMHKFVVTENGNSGFLLKNRGYDTERVESSVFLANKEEMTRKQENQKYTKKPRLL